jgi:hypothetical protein
MTAPLHGPGFRCYEATCDCHPALAFVVRRTPEAQALVDELVSALSVRAGEVLTEELIQERAANGAARLMAAYELKRREETTDAENHKG